MEGRPLQLNALLLEYELIATQTHIATLQFSEREATGAAKVEYVVRL